MTHVNEHFLKLKSSYLFSEIARRVRAFTEARPHAQVIRLGIGDVTRPLAPAVVQALHEAAEEMGREATFLGYGPETVYPLLTKLLSAHDCSTPGDTVEPDE